MYNQIFYTNILRLLNEQGMTKSDLSEKADVSISFLSDLTNGHANPSLKIMESIAAALDVSLPYLLESTDLDSESLALLYGEKAPSSLPPGFERVNVVLPDHQAYTVKQWAESAKKRWQKR